MNGPLAHGWLEQRTHNPLVLCSTHRGPTNYADIDENIIDAEWEEIPKLDPNLIRVYKMVENLLQSGYIGRKIDFII